MQPELLPSVARDQLNLVLSFFSHVDRKSSVVLAVDIGMLGYLAAKLPAPAWPPSCVLLIPLVAFILNFVSLWCLYKAAFPRLQGGNASLVYFNEIAKRTEAKFIHEFTSQEEMEYAKDLLGQVWTNSEILVCKFKYIKWAFIFMALAVLPWVVALLLLDVNTR